MPDSPHFEDTPPTPGHLTEYDRQHNILYLRILDAAAEGADWREVVAILFDLNAKIEPERARRVYDAHLARAKWMTTTGYRQLASAGWTQ